MANRAINGGIISRRIASVELIDLLTSVAEDPRAHAPGPEVFCNIGALATGTHNETGDLRESPARGGDGVVTAPRQGLVAKSGDSRNPVGVTGSPGQSRIKPGRAMTPLGGKTTRFSFTGICCSNGCGKEAGGTPGRRKYHARPQVDSRKSGGVRSRPGAARPRARGGAAHRHRRTPPRRYRQGRAGPRSAQRRLEGNRRGQEGQGQREGAGRDGRGQRIEGVDPEAGSGGEDSVKAAGRGAVMDSQPAARGSARRRRRARQRRASSVRGEAQLYVFEQAEGAFRAGRSARTDGLRDGGEALGFALRRVEEGARSDGSCAGAVYA